MLLLRMSVRLSTSGGVEQQFAVVSLWLSDYVGWAHKVTSFCHTPHCCINADSKQSTDHLLLPAKHTESYAVCGLQTANSAGVKNTGLVWREEQSLTPWGGVLGMGQRASLYQLQNLRDRCRLTVSFQRSKTSFAHIRRHRTLSVIIIIISL